MFLAVGYMDCVPDAVCVGDALGRYLNMANMVSGYEFGFRAFHFDMYASDNCGTEENLSVPLQQVLE